MAPPGISNGPMHGGLFLRSHKRIEVRAVVAVPAQGALTVGNLLRRTIPAHSTWVVAVFVVVARLLLTLHTHPLLVAHAAGESVRTGAVAVVVAVGLWVTCLALKLCVCVWKFITRT